VSVVGLALIFSPGATPQARAVDTDDVGLFRSRAALQAKAAYKKKADAAEQTYRLAMRAAQAEYAADQEKEGSITR
jgi:hypothetical protein